MREHTCCFSGHRNVGTGDSDMALQLMSVVDDLIAEGYDRFIVGGAIGFDMLCAAVLIQFKRRGFDIHLTFALPCHDHTRLWREKDRVTLELFMKSADEVVYLSERYDNSCMQRRNRYMVDRSTTCVCYLNRGGTGTSSTVRYARSKGIRIINLADSIKR